MEKSKITKTDVLNVAKQLNFKPTKKQVTQVLKESNLELKNSDSDEMWFEVVENVLYSLNIEQS